MTGLADTITALKNGVTKMTVAAAVSNIEMWEKELTKIEGGHQIIADLGKLKTALHDKSPDASSIKALMTKLSTETTKAAGHAGAQKAHVEELGKLLHV